MLSLLLLALPFLTAAQSSSSTSTAAVSTTISSAVSTGTSGCGSQIDITIQTCLTQLNAQLAACATTDWDCLCTQSTNVLTCYNNCPSDPNAFGSKQQNTAYCNAAKAYPSTSTKTAANATAAASSAASGAATGSGSGSTTTNAASGTLYTGLGEASGSTPTATSQAGAAATVIPAGLAAVAGLLALI
ncbi:GPI anchored serine-threonine rich protein [Teratosphaeria destructans]|uniref:GPI anchored serine-threonine rich protein n=1 Tax=Teratosphaeria destructans TaxID=418781 RepID=A0A9W7VZ27_9PEZI|nr:GPI anchored serine-threonine rich protein [Teratosphaeria destructans]